MQILTVALKGVAVVVVSRDDSVATLKNLH
jgi:hypothetical protein